VEHNSNGTIEAASIMHLGCRPSACQWNVSTTAWQGLLGRAAWASQPLPWQVPTWIGTPCLQWPASWHCAVPSVLTGTARGHGCPAAAGGPGITHHYDDEAGMGAKTTHPPVSSKAADLDHKQVHSAFFVSATQKAPHLCYLSGIWRCQVLLHITDTWLRHAPNP
jgi:hypothetical protein